MSSNIAGDRKLEFLEGARGVAALVVVVQHCLELFYPAMLNGSDSPGKALSWMSLTPLFLLYSGRAAVCFFFVLSGFVLSYKSFSTKSRSAAFAGVFKRYPRLAIPIVASTILCMVLMMTGAISHDTILAVRAHSQTGMYALYNFHATLIDALKKSLFVVFAHSSGDYNLALWTMHFEFFGSMFVFALLLLFGSSKYRFLGYTVCFWLIFSRPYYLGFFLGMVMCDLWCNKPKSFPQRWFWLPLACGVYAAGFPWSFPKEEIARSCYGWLSAPPDLIIVLGSAACLFAILSSPFLRNYFDGRLFSMLGRISFSLYLTHLAVLFGLTTHLFCFFVRYLTYDQSVFVSVLLSLPVMFAVAHLGCRYVDTTAVRVAGKFYSLLKNGWLAVYRGRRKEAVLSGSEIELEKVCVQV